MDFIFVFMCVREYIFLDVCLYLRGICDTDLFPSSMYIVRDLVRFVLVNSCFPTNHIIEYV